MLKHGSSGASKEAVTNMPAKKVPDCNLMLVSIISNHGVPCYT